VVDVLASRLGGTRFTGRYAGRLAAARGPSGPVGLLVPLTFMNESGRSVGPAAGALHAAPEQVLVVHDEIDLPFGTVRGKVGGGAGGHNGLRSVARGLGTDEYPRLRLAKCVWYLWATPLPKDGKAGTPHSFREGLIMTVASADKQPGKCWCAFARM